MLRSDTPYAFYNTDPPISGPHVNQVPLWGMATTPVPKAVQVHVLEDGGVLIHNQPTLDPKTLEKLTALIVRYEAQVLLNPAPDLAQAIVVTTWGQMLRFPTYDEVGFQRFIEAFRGQDHHLDSGS